MTAVLTSDIALAVVLGSAFGAGVCVLLALVPRWGAPSLERRVAPYVRDVTDARGGTAWIPPIDLVGSVMARAARTLNTAIGGADSTARRLAQAGLPIDVPAFRARQLVWGASGLLVGGLTVVALAMLAEVGPAAALIPPVMAVGGVVARDAMLSAAARSRTARVREELPTVLEFLSLCLAAGEGLRDSLRRIGEIGSGELTGELRRVSVAVGMGEPLAAALTGLAARLQVPAVTRSVDHLVAAIDRGAPLAGVLHAQAADAREEAKQSLIERAGRNELAMLFPLVFIILPMSVIFAVYPGIFMLRLGIG